MLLDSLVTSFFNHRNKISFLSATILLLTMGGPPNEILG